MFQKDCSEKKNNFNYFSTHIAGNKRVFKRTIPGLVGALFNIILHLQSPFIFYIEKLPPHCSEFHPDAGAVVLMCVEVITSFVGRRSFQIDASHVSQCLHVPVTLFKGFKHLLACRKIPSANYCKQTVEHADHNEYILDRQFSIDIYASCCKLLCTTLRHQQRYMLSCFLFPSVIFVFVLVLILFIWSFVLVRLGGVWHSWRTR
jgi:hypothetical protein